jgi:hypothetical protein
MQFLHPSNVNELATIAAETGAEVLCSPLRYPSGTGSWQLGDVDLGEHLWQYRDCEVTVIIAATGRAEPKQVVCGRQAIKDAGVAVWGSLMGDRVGCDEVEGGAVEECNARGRRVHRWFWSGGEGAIPSPTMTYAALGSDKAEVLLHSAVLPGRVAPPSSFSITSPLDMAAIFHQWHLSGGQSSELEPNCGTSQPYMNVTTTVSA